MSDATPTLYVFAISHYCEKARFALDYLGVETQLVHLPPGPHMQIAKELGAAGSSLPILVADGAVIQGSSEIIDWAKGQGPGEKTLTPAGLRDECLAIERRLDDSSGVHTRRAFYSEALLDRPETVLPVFAQGLTPEEQKATTDAWPMITQLMIQAMDLGREQEQESTRIVEAELAWLDDLLADGREFLVGDRFSRADLTAASLYAPLVKPPEHPTCAAIELPPRLAELIASWRGRRSLQWVGEIYRQFR